MVEQVRPKITVEDIVELGEVWVEVIDGEFVELEMSAGLLHNQVAINMQMILTTFVREHKLGSVHTDGLTYILQVDDSGVQNTRLPDISFIRRGRIKPEANPAPPFMGAPDLAVEVTSPGQTADSLRGRVRDYLQYGSEEVWVIYVATKEVYQYTSRDPSRPTIYGEDDTFGSDTLFPGLAIPVTELFDLSDLYA